jgi:dihydroorotate dehydrogenase
MGLRFRNHLGLAARYDKDGLALAGLACLNFGQDQPHVVARPGCRCPGETAVAHSSLGGETTCVIGMVGIDSPERARQRLDSGADLIQGYRELVHIGPGQPGPGPPELA